MTRARDLARLGNSQALSVDSNFNVGINSTQPDSKLDVVGVVSATSFYGDGSNLTGIAATDTVSTSSLNVIGISTLGGFTTFGNNAFIAGVVTATSFSGTVPSSNLSGALPALDGSALTNLNIPAGFNELDAALFN
jgi:hypothetical protein